MLGRAARTACRSDATCLARHECAGTARSARGCGGRLSCSLNVRARANTLRYTHIRMRYGMPCYDAAVLLPSVRRLTTYLRRSTTSIPMTTTSGSSGTVTWLNARRVQKIRLSRAAPFNDAEMFRPVARRKCVRGVKIPAAQRCAVRVLLHRVAHLVQPRAP